jgi:F-type H+-transporting ATPase subunit b
MELLKLLSTNEIVVQILSFLVLFFLLRAFFWKRLLKLLDDRKEKISSELKNIEEEKAKALKTKAEYEEKLKAIEKIAMEKINEAVLESQKIRQELREDGRREAIKIVEGAKRETQQEIVRAKEELKEQIIDLVLGAAETLLEERINDEEDRRIVKDFLKGIDKIK